LGSSVAVETGEADMAALLAAAVVIFREFKPA
jgi:hypothetical protein